MPEVIGSAEIAAAVATIEALPKAMRAAVAGLSEAQIDTPYREGADGRCGSLCTMSRTAI